MYLLDNMMISSKQMISDFFYMITWDTLFGDDTRANVYDHDT